MCLCVVLSTANLAHSWTHPPFILCALLWAFAQRHLMVEVIHNFWKPVLLASLFSAAVDSWLLLSSWSSTPSVCPQRHKVDICTLLTENHTVYPLKANFRVHLSSSRCSPVSWDVVPTTVSDFQLFCQPQSRLSISFSLYQAGLAWLLFWLSSSMELSGLSGSMVKRHRGLQRSQSLLLSPQHPLYSPILITVFMP